VGSVVAQKTLDCELAVEVVPLPPPQFAFKYTFRNGGRLNAFLFNRLYRRLVPGPVFETDANLVYVEVNTSSVRLSKKTIPVPDDICVEKPVIPCATLVKPDGTFTETVSVVLPLESRTPYPGVRARRELCEDPELLDAYFELGFVLVPNDGLAWVRQVDTAGGRAWCFNSVDPEKQTVLRAGPFPARLPVRRRS